MLHVSIDRDRPSVAARRRGPVTKHLHRLWPEMAGAAAALLLAALFITIDPCPDVGWQLWIGHQLRHGARFYVDIIETNPPLWFWMAVPIDWAAGLAGIGPAEAMVAAMGVLSALAVVATGRLLGSLSSPYRAALLIYAALALMLMPLADIGQREQILLIGAVPYAALAARRHERRAVSRRLAIVAGLAGAVGFALKHYFLIAPALIEVWLFASLRRGYRPIRPETAALTLFGLIYAIAVVTLTPAYLHDILPMLRLTYGALEVERGAAMIGVVQAYWAIMLALLLSRIELLARTPVAAAFTILATGFAAAWLIQFKGWHNHEVPVTGCLMLAVASFVAAHWRALRSGVWVAAPTLLVLPLLCALFATPYRNPTEVMTRPMLAGLAATDGVAFVSENSTYAWPLSLDRGFRYPSRHYGMWMFTALVREGAGNPALVRLERRVVDETAQDYACAQPKRIIFDQHVRGGFDMERFFVSSPRFAELMHHYRRIGRYGRFDVFQRIAAFPAPPAGSCRRGV